MFLLSSAWLAAGYALTVLLHEGAHAVAAVLLGADDVRIGRGLVAYEEPAGWSTGRTSVLLLAGPLVTTMQIPLALACARRRRNGAFDASLWAWLATLATAHLGTTLVLGVLGSDIGRALAAGPAGDVTPTVAALAGAVLLATCAGPLARVHDAALAPSRGRSDGGANVRVAAVAMPWLLVGIPMQLLLVGDVPIEAHFLMSIPIVAVVTGGRGGFSSRDHERHAGEPADAASTPPRSIRHGLLLLLLALATWRVLTIAFRLAAGDASTLPLVSTFINLVAAVVALLIAGAAGSMSPARLGFGRRHAGRQLAGGAALGFGAAATTVGILLLLGAAHSHLVAASPTYQPLLAVLVFFAFASIWEELVFRGILFGLGRIAFGTWAAIVLSSGAFGWVHAGNPAASPRSIAVTVAAGFVLALLFARTGGLWAPVAFHLSWNLGVGVVAGLPVSGIDVGTGFLGLAGGGQPRLDGGPYGPEGGYVAMAVLVGVGALLVLVSALRRPAAPDPRPPVRPRPQGTPP